MLAPYFLSLKIDYTIGYRLKDVFYIYYYVSRIIRFYFYARFYFLILKENNQLFS